MSSSKSLGSEKCLLNLTLDFCFVYCSVFRLKSSEEKANYQQTMQSFLLILLTVLCQSEYGGLPGVPGELHTSLPRPHRHPV